MSGEEITIKSAMRFVWVEGGFCFEWKGGGYIDVRTYHDEMRGPTVVDAINVYDYERGAPTISTLGDAQGAVIKWITDHQEQTRHAGQ